MNEEKKQEGITPPEEGGENDEKIETKQIDTNTADAPEVEKEDPDTKVVPAKRTAPQMSNNKLKLGQANNLS